MSSPPSEPFKVRLIGHLSRNDKLVSPHAAPRAQFDGRRQQEEMKSTQEGGKQQVRLHHATKDLTARSRL